MSYPKSQLGKLHIKKADLLRELDAVLSAIEAGLVTTSGDGSIVNNAGDVRVGVLATDTQHGNRGGGLLHSTATTAISGFLSATDKTKLDTVVSVTNWTVTDWYIDGVIGNDTNSGTVVGSPLRTGAELLRRLGPYAIWGQNVTIHVLANGMIDPLILQGVLTVAGTHIDVVGTPTQVADAGTVVTYTGVDHATPLAPQISTSAIADFGVYVGSRLRITSGVRVGAISWIERANPGGAGVSIAQCSSFDLLDQTLASSFTKSTTPLLGDGVVIESLPPVPSVRLQLDGPLSTVTGAAWPQRQSSILSLDCPIVEVITAAVSPVYHSMVHGCKIGMTTENSTPFTFAPYYYKSGCAVVYAPPLTTTTLLMGTYRRCCFQGNTFSTSAMMGSTISESLFTQRLSIVYLGSLVGCQFFDITAHDCIMLNRYGKLVIQSGFSGARNSLRAIGIYNNSDFACSGTVNVSAIIGFARLQSTPVIELALSSYLIQPTVDFSQKGITPAMVAGSTTVTVPWYDSTTQQVTVSHAAFAGTPGILSVQQISNTQFTVTSSNALDTSTVRWQISPLGRNIFISTTLT